MTLELNLVHRFKQQVEQACPKVGMLLYCCYVQWSVKTASESVEAEPSFHLTLYCPNILFATLKAHQDILQQIARKMGSTEVVYLNARRCLRDPDLNLMQTNPRLWLILRWLEGTLAYQETNDEDGTLLHLRKSLSECPSSYHGADCAGTTCRSLGF